MQCPKCGSDCWDNRQKKASGEYKPNAPDYKCKECKNPIWLDSGDPAAALAEEPPTQDELEQGMPDLEGTGPGKPQSKPFAPTEFCHAIDDAAKLRIYAMEKHGMHPPDEAVAAWATSLFIQRMRG